MLATIRADTWNVLSKHHIAKIWKDGIIQASPVVPFEQIKGPTHVVEGGHQLPPTRDSGEFHNLIKYIGIYTQHLLAFYRK